MTLTQAATVILAIILAVAVYLGANDLSAVKEIILVHLSEGNSHEGEFKKAVQAATGRMVRVAEKGGEK